LRKRLISEDAQVLSGVYHFGIFGRQKSVLDGDLSFLDRDQSGFLVLDRDIERCTADRDYCSWRGDAVVVWLAAKLLDVDLYPAKPDVEQILPVRRVGPERHAGIRKYLKGASIRDLKQRKPVRAGDNDLLDGNDAANLQGPRTGIPQYRDLSAQLQYASGSICSNRRQLSRTH